MKFYLPTLALTLLLTLQTFSQTASPTPPPDNDVVKISTNLIQLDVTVTDSKGKIVRDLKPEDFEVYENGQKQDLTAFSFVSSVKSSSEIVKSTDKNVPVPPTAIRLEQVRRTIALVVDDISLSYQSVYYVRRALKKYVDEQMQEGDLVAIIRTGANVGTLQQFTSDKKLLYAAIERVKWNPLASGKITPLDPINDSEILPNENETNDGSNDEETTRNPSESLENFRSTAYVQGTLGVLRFIVDGMRELPGRKSVILFSDGININQRDEQNNSISDQIIYYLRQIIDAANRASVVIYTIDARGLLTTGLTAQDSVNPTAERLQQINSSRSQLIADSQEGLLFLAKETGGLAVLNNNNVSESVRRAVDDQSYYLLGYEPDADTFDSQKRRFNKIEIRVKRKDVTVRYRSGFFNVASENMARNTVTLTPVEQIQNALVSPFAVNDISLRLNTLFGFNATQGTFVRSLLHVKAEDLKFTDEPEGVKKAVFDVLAVSFGDNGTPIDQIAKTYTLRVKGETYKKILSQGFVYHFTFPVKKPGAYQFRVAIRDSQAQKIGSASQFIEVPNLKKERLTLSGIVLENLTIAQWKADLGNTNGTANQNSEQDRTDPLTDTSLRRFKRGTVLRYGFEVYNAKLDNSKRPNLTTQIRVFRQGKLLLDGKQNPLDLTGQTDFQRVKSVGAISLADQMEPGEYILQIIVYDNLAKENRRISTHFVQFELVE